MPGVAGKAPATLSAVKELDSEDYVVPRRILLATAIGNLARFVPAPALLEKSLLTSILADQIHDPALATMDVNRHFAASRLVDMPGHLHHSILRISSRKLSCHLPMQFPATI
jgi:hypothetical protein